MRLRLGSASIALLLGLVHCAALEEIIEPGEASATNAPRRGTEEGGGPNAAGTAEAGGRAAPKEDPPLAFAFDGRDTLRARVRANVAAGASLVTRVYAIEHGEDRTIDCAKLRSRGQAVDLGRATASGPVVVADVPTRSEVFADRLDGTTRTAIDACLFDPSGKVIAEVATSLMNAWDNDAATAAASPRVFHGVQAYTDACIEELGELPMFANGDFDCAGDPAMVVVPITATQNGGKVTSITDQWPLSAAEENATEQCDRPAWLDYGDASPCSPFTRVGRWVNSRGTRIVGICRRRGNAPPADDNFAVTGFIAHNPDSGRTCFFNLHLDGSASDGRHIPPPNSPTADRVWMDMGGLVAQRCVTCHDSDPWIHTPWMDQALGADGHFVVPRIGDDPAYDVSTKYSIFARESFLRDDDPASFEDWQPPRYLLDAGACGTCHRIGSAGTASEWAGRSVGEFFDWQATWLTDSFRGFSKLHWMPTTPMSQRDWASSESARAMNLIDRCGEDPSSCRLAEVPH